MLLVDPVYNGIPLGDAANIAGYIKTPLEKLGCNCPTLECYRRNSDYCSLHWNTTGRTITAPKHQTHIVNRRSIHASLKWQDDGTPSRKWTGLCKFSFYLKFNTLQYIPVLLVKRVSTSTSPCACLGNEQQHNFCTVHWNTAGQTVLESHWLMISPNGLSVQSWQSSVNLHNWNTLEGHWSHKYTGMPLKPHWLMLARSGIPLAIQC